MRNGSFASLAQKRIHQVVQQPGLVFVQARRWFPSRAARRDPQLNHLLSAWSSGKLSRAAITELFPDIERCDVLFRKPYLRDMIWATDLEELACIIAVAKATKAIRILEIGTYDGFTALNIAANLGDGGEITTVDLPQDSSQSELRSRGMLNATISNLVGSQFRNEPEAVKIRQLWADSTTTDWGTFGGPFDLIFIDGCHAYPYVLSDSLNAFKQIRSGGTIFWHDYGAGPDVSRVIDELARDRRIYAIKGTRLACFRA